MAKILIFSIYHKLTGLIIVKISHALTKYSSHLDGAFVTP